MFDPEIVAKREEAARMRAHADRIDRECDDIERQRKRVAAEDRGQLWLGKFVELLKALPADASVEFEDGTPFVHWHSYRGDYADLAIDSDPRDSSRTVAQVIVAAGRARNMPHSGWKGGEFWMHDDTILWRAGLRESPGRPIVGVEMRDGKCMVLTEAPYSSR